MARHLIQVCGDPTVDWLSIRSEGPAWSDGSALWKNGGRRQAVRLTAEPGGAAMLTRLVAQLLPKARVDGITFSAADSALTDPGTGQVATSWSVWRRYPFQGEQPYRMEGWHERGEGTWKYGGENRKTGRPDVLLIEDTNLGFRNLDPAEWPEALTDDSARPGQIIMRLTQFGDLSVGHKLLDHLKATGLAGRTTIVTGVDDLRACSVKVSLSLSWERMLDEVVAAVYSPASPFTGLNGELAFARVLVGIGPAGAVLIEPRRQTLVFDRTGQEGDFVLRRGGLMPGYATCMVAAFARACVSALGTERKWDAALRRGVALARQLFLLGYVKDRDRHLRFPYGALVEGIRRRKKQSPVWTLGVFTRPGKASGGDAWSILEQSMVDEAIPYQIVLRGPENVLRNIPVERVGNWKSADRREIEGVRSVNNALRRYRQEPDSSTPLCIGVFGPPGAGKSFAVKEIAKELGIGPEATLTFNLSQFESPEELPEAFHQIRDLNLKGKLPLVFWDEFDTPCQGRRLGWLRYFLAPMQDGEFADRGRIHPVGRGIYVFAGATRHSFEAFRSGDSHEERDAKKPDFVSRLRAYIDVRGPNADPHSLRDPAHVIRRAFLLNSHLERHAGHLKEGGAFQVDPCVLEAFLKVGRYRHGARSMETLVRMSALAGKRKFEVSSLPPDSVLSMHTVASEFTALSRRGYARMLKVGITGHIGLDPARLDLLEEGVRQGVALIAAQFPDRALTVFSLLARGADRLVARELLRQPGARLIAVLPVPADDYVFDFGKTDQHAVDYAGAELRQEFRYWLARYCSEVIEMAPTPTRDEAYLKAGYEVADHSDVLVAVWDGQPAQGKGGTGDIVERAVRRGIPIVHVWAANYKDDPARRTTIPVETGTVRRMNFSDQAEKGVWL